MALQVIIVQNGKHEVCLEIFSKTNIINLEYR